MPLIIEDNLAFTFPSSWVVEKYDATTFYTRHFQHLSQSKAVDIVAITDSNDVWLIEVKDYRAHRRAKTLEVFAEMAAKVRDTLAGLIVAQRRPNDAFHALAANIPVASSFRVALHFEQPAKHSKLYPIVVDRSNARLKLRQAVRVVDQHAIFCEINAMPLGCAWTVQCTN